MKTPMVPLFHLPTDVEAVRIEPGVHQRALPFAWLAGLVSDTSRFARLYMDPLTDLSLP